MNCFQLAAKYNSVRSATVLDFFASISAQSQETVTIHFKGQTISKRPDDLTSDFAPSCPGAILMCNNKPLRGGKWQDFGCHELTVTEIMAPLMGGAGSTKKVKSKFW
jgi:hypothetical protein